MRPVIEKKGLIIAAALALIATILVVSWLNQQRRRMADDMSMRFKELHANTVDAIYAKSDIPRGKIISEDMLFTKPITKNSLPPEAATSLTKVIDNVATVNIKEDSIILSDMVGPPAAKEATLAMKTPIGKRAISVSVDNISSLVGMIKPGDYVDVISLILLPAMVEGKQAAQPATVPLFQNVQVLAVGAQLNRTQEAEISSRRRKEEPASREAAPLITLALSPEETNLLAFVQEQGKIRLVLRSPADAKIEVVQPASWETLLRYLYPNMNLQPDSDTLKKGPPQVEIVRGFKKEMMPITQEK